MATFIATHDQVRNLRTFPTLPVRGKNILADTTTTRAAERKLNATGGTQQGHTPRFRAMAAAGVLFAAGAVFAAGLGSLLYAAWVLLARA